MEELKTQKCPRCKTLRKPSQFIFNEKPHKCCIVCRDTSKAQYAKNKEKNNEKSKKYYLENKEKKKEYSKNYYENNTEKVKDNHKKWSVNNPEKIKEINKKHIEKMKTNNPLEYKFRRMINTSKETDKIKNIFDDENYIDIDYLNKLYEIQNGLCLYCKCLMDLDFTRDNTNKISIQRINNDIGHIKINCVFSCLNCNVSRQENKYDETHYMEILDKMNTKY